MTRRLWLGVAGAAVLATLIAVPTLAPARPSVLSVEAKPHGSIIAVSSVIIDDLPMFKWSLDGRTEGRGIAYSSPFDTTIAVQVMWYDVDSKLFYSQDFDLDTRDLSTFGKNGDHASVKIVMGPGADVTVSTPNPEELRLLGLNRANEITPETDVDITLAELCAKVSENDPSPDSRLKLETASPPEIARARFNQQNWLSQSEAPRPRCKSEVQP